MSCEMLCSRREADDPTLPEFVLSCLSAAILNDETFAWSIAHGPDVVAWAWARCCCTQTMRELLYEAGLERCVPYNPRLRCGKHVRIPDDRGHVRCEDCRNVLLRLYPEMTLARLLESAKTTEVRR